MTKTRSKPQPTLPRRPLYTAQEITAEWKRIVPDLKEGEGPAEAWNRLAWERHKKDSASRKRAAKEALTEVRAAAEGSVRRQHGKVTTSVVDTEAMVSMRMPAALLAKIDDWASTWNISRSEVIRNVLEVRFKDD